MNPHAWKEPGCRASTLGRRNSGCKGQSRSRLGTPEDQRPGCDPSLAGDEERWEMRSG